MVTEDELMPDFVGPPSPQRMEITILTLVDLGEYRRAIDLARQLKTWFSVNYIDLRQASNESFYLLGMVHAIEIIERRLDRLKYQRRYRRTSEGSARKARSS